MTAVLDRLFKAEHVAVIGASSTPGKIGNTVIRNLLKGGFGGLVSPINSGGTAVEGLPAYRSLAELPRQVDVAFIVVPAAAAVEAVQHCADAGVAFTIVGAAGFAELGDAIGIGRQARMTEIARAAGMRLIGPNTNGILSTTDRLPLGYNASHAEAMEPGSVSVVSHSGALFDGVARRLRGFGSGLAKFIPVGNEADVDMLDFVAYLIDDPATRIIGLIIEGLPDGARFRSLAVQAGAKGKPIVALKIGRSQAGAQAALAHSSRLAGSARAYDALFRESGVAVVPTVEALAGACALLASLPEIVAHDPRLVCVTSSGAGGALVMDFASQRDLALAGEAGGVWPAVSQRQIDALPAAAPIRHPIDLGSLGDWSLLSPVLEILDGTGFGDRSGERSGDQFWGPLLAYSHIAAQAAMTEALFAALQSRKARVPAPVLVLAPGGLTEAVEARYRDIGIPVFQDTGTCFDSLAAFYAAKLAPAAVAPAPAVIDPVRQAHVRTLLGDDAAMRVLSELQSAAVLRAMGMPMVRSVAVQTAAEATAAAGALGYPVVLKALVPGIAHKHDHGLVAVGLKDAATLQGSFDAMAASAGRLEKLAGSTEFIVQPMHAAKAEIILGLSSEGHLGTFLIAGFGGVNAELLDEVIVLPVPVTAAAITARLAASRVGRLLAAVTGDRDAVLDSVTGVLLALQQLAIEQPGMIRSVDINPLLISASGCVAVDALVVTEPK